MGMIEAFEKERELYSKKVTEVLSPHKNTAMIQVSHGTGFMRIDRRSPVLWPTNFVKSESLWPDVPLVTEPQPKIASNEWETRLVLSYENNQKID